MTLRASRCAAITALVITQLPLCKAFAVENISCRLASVKLAAGMPRLEVERSVASILAIRPSYSPYANNLQGGAVEYKDDNCILIVSYQPGAPAPLLGTETGKTQHFEPRDESVISYKLIKYKPE